MKKCSVKLWLLLLTGLLYACDADMKYNTTYPCNFVFFTYIYPTSALTHALNNTGQFVIVKPKNVGGVTHLVLTPNHGSWDSADLDLAMRTAIGNEKLSYNSMGAGRGLIIGRSNFYGLKAYDLQCPNCLNNFGSPKYELQWTDDGNYLTCNTCKRVYMADNDEGLVVEGGQKGDKMLIQYRNVSYNSTEGRLYVHN